MARRSTYKIELMSIAHFDDVTRLWKGSEGVGLDASDSRPAIRRYLVRNAGLSFVARVGTTIVGAVLCGHDGRRGYLYHLAVSPEHRGNGLGQKLVRRCLDKLKRIGIHKCNIYVFADNSRAEKFWVKRGWVARPGVATLQKVLIGSELKRSC